MNMKRTLPLLMSVFVAVLWGQPNLPQDQPITPGVVAPMLMILADVSEHETLQKDIAEIEEASHTAESLEKRLTQWARERNLILHNENHFYYAISRRFLEQSPAGQQLKLTRLLSQTLEQSQALSLNELPPSQQRAIRNQLSHYEIMPGAVVRGSLLLRANASLYLMAGAVVYVEVPVEDTPLRVIVKEINAYPENWGTVLFHADTQPPKQETSSQQALPSGMTILYTHFVAVNTHHHKAMVRRLMELWEALLEATQREHQQAVSELRQKFEDMVTKEFGGPVNTELSGSELPAELVQRIVNRLQERGYSLSPDALARSRVKVGVALRLQAASVGSSDILLKTLPFGGDWGPPAATMALPLNKR